MAGFNFSTVDPLFESLGTEHKDTLTAIARAQAEGLIPAIQDSAIQSANMTEAEIEAIAKKVMVDLDENSFNRLLAETHPAVLEAMFSVGFTQGFCMKHRLASLDGVLYAMTDAEYLDEDDEEEEDNDEVEDAEASEADSDADTTE